MNKAFVREPDDTQGVRCPRCDSLGILVRAEALDALLSPIARRTFPESAWFCPFPRCDVAYFDAFERSVDTSALVRAVYPKDPAAPICACFGFTCDEIEQDVREGTATRCKNLLAKTKTTEAH
jgi:hypothetical protein